MHASLQQVCLNDPNLMFLSVIKGTTAINSLLIGQIMAAVMASPEFQNGTWTIAHVTSNLTLVSGLICLLVGVLRLGILFDFICQPAIAGFMAGSGLTIVVNQVRKEIAVIG